MAAALTAAIFFQPLPGRADNIYGTQQRLDNQPGNQFQMLLEITENGSTASSGFVFGPLQGLYAHAFLDGRLYASEFEADVYYLASLAHAGGLRGQGARVSGASFGMPRVEGLTNVDGQLYASSLREPGHETVIATVDKDTGLATEVGRTSRNVMIVGLAYDPVRGKMYGAGAPFGAGEASAVNTPNLYEIDTTTGAETFVGEFGVRIEGLAWDENLGLIGTFESFYTINQDTGAATQVGSADYTEGAGGVFNGVWGLASLVPPGVGGALCGDANSDGNRTAGDALIALKTSVGSDSCLPCICDANGQGGITATDALLILQFGVGQNITLACPAC